MAVLGRHEVMRVRDHYAALSNVWNDPQALARLTAVMLAGVLVLAWAACRVADLGSVDVATTSSSAAT
jgi:hypothetical protein